MWQLISHGSYEFSLLRSKLSHYNGVEMNCLCFFLFSLLIRLDTTPVSVLPPYG